MSRLRTGVVALSCAWCGTAGAQMLPPDISLVPFQRYTAVRDRVIPGLQPTGLPLGGFTLSPSIEGGLNYDDNIYAIETPRVSDGFVSITPAASLQSNWSRDSLNLNVNSEIDRFFSHSSEDRESVDASLYGIKEIGASTRVRAILRYNTARESRESQNVFVLTKRPVRYEDETGAIGISHTFANFLVSGSAGVERTHYFNASLMDGTLVDESYRNNDDFQLRLRTEYAQSSALAYFIEGTRDKNTYNRDVLLNLNRNSENYQVLGGIRFELPILARGEIGVGYLNSTYRDVRARTFSGLALNSTLTFFPTQLVTITLNGSRSANDAGTPNSTAYIALAGGGRVDYELLRSVILTAGVQDEQDSFNGLNRQDNRIDANAGIEYRYNRWSLRATYSHLDVSSDGRDRYKSFLSNRVLIALGLRI